MFSEERKTLEHINKKWVKVITVITYIISVSLVALILGLYYKLAWNPKYDFENKSLTKADSNHLIDDISLGTIEIDISNGLDKKFNLDILRKRVYLAIEKELTKNEPNNQTDSNKFDQIELKSKSKTNFLFSIIIKN
ncbi:transmembrane INAFM2 [Brachionus plicatilis]|uniref:Transmembrane INAFM2 n=1 Tax=Brachionus plicatilis TaxID=10195 RepID=A0A3M7PT76_BRAPC|nr:transmembrane INAFM2 [Brachionus plicatilis]